MWCWSSRSASWARVTLIGLSSAAALFFVVLLAYQLALARVPQHRATLERLLRVQTGLDVRFSTLGVRWGWYGPEAVFRNVELGEPGSANVLLRAPELTVGFDAWRTMRSGHLEAGRVALIAPDINLEHVGSEPRTDHVRAGAHAGGARGRLLERWRDGRIDIEGGTLRLPDPDGATSPFLLQIRRASVRRSGDEWNLFALLFLPERLGRTARVALRLEGGLDQPDTLSGSLRFEGRRLTFAGWRDFASFAPEVAPYAPVSGGGDVTVNLDFTRGRIEKANGNVLAGGVVLGSPAAAQRMLSLDRLRGQWRLARHGSDWRIRVDELELGAPAGDTAAKPASLLIDTAEDGEWARGKLEEAPLQAVASIARWLAPHFDLAGVELGGTARELIFDWDSHRRTGRKLAASGRLEDVSVTPPSHAFVLSGMTARVSGDENGLDADVKARAARLELAAAPQYPLEGVHVASQFRFGRADEGWQISTDRLELRHEATRLVLSGTLSGGGARLQPEMVAQGELTAADVPFVQRVLGSGVAEAFGAAAASLTAGHVDRAQFELRGPLDELPYSAENGEFAGSVTLRDAVVSGGGRWPDATGVAARVEWHGADVQVVADTGQAGPFKLANATAEWRATGQQSAHVTAQVQGRLEDAIAWMHGHPDLAAYAPQAENFGLEGAAQLDVDISVPENGKPQTRVVASLEGARLRWVSGAVPIQALTGSVAFEGGRLQRSTLSGTWLGGPVTLRLHELRERGQTVLAMQAHGTLGAEELAMLESIDTQGRLEGSADWTGDFAFLPASESQPARWRVRADSNLVGVASGLPEPFAKASSAPLPLHIDLSGTDAGAQLHISLGDRIRSVLALQRTADAGWRVERGAVNLGVDADTLGAATAVLPTEPLVRVQGRLNRLDLPTYLGPWLNSWLAPGRQTRLDPHTSPVQAQIFAAEVLIAGRSYPAVTLVGGRTDAEVQLQLDSETLAGVVRWPLSGAGSRAADIRLMRLSIPRRTEEGAPASVLGEVAAAAAMAATARLSIDDLVWEGMRIGHLTATLAARDGGVILDDVRVSGSTHDGTGTVQCQAALASCRAIFTLESSDAAATLVDFGFRPDLSASQAQLRGELEWEPHADKPWAATLVGRLSMKMADGATRVGVAQDGRAFALLAVPALVSGMIPPSGDGAPRTPPRELRFARLEADFDLKDGQASTSDLHFDGDAEILMRGRTGLVARDYDQQVWILKGEDRLPAAVRRLGPTPRMAAAWLTLRELFAADEDRARALLRLQGSWDAPVVMAANP